MQRAKLDRNRGGKNELDKIGGEERKYTNRKRRRKAREVYSSERNMGIYQSTARITNKHARGHGKQSSAISALRKQSSNVAPI